MVYINNHDITDIRSGIIEIVRVYSGTNLVWSKIREFLSCYANGYWIDQYPWTDNTPWKD